MDKGKAKKQIDAMTRNLLCARMAWEAAATPRTPKMERMSSMRIRGYRLCGGTVDKKREVATDTIADTKWTKPNETSQTPSKWPAGRPKSSTARVNTPSANDDPLTNNPEQASAHWKAAVTREWDGFSRGIETEL